MLQSHEEKSQAKKIFYKLKIGIAIKSVLVGIRLNPYRFWREISKLTEYRFENYPIFLIRVEVKDEDVTTRSIPILVFVPIMKLLKFY